MAVVLSEDFDNFTAFYTSGFWTFAGSPNTFNLEESGCDVSGYLAACSGSTTARRNVTIGPNVSLRYSAAFSMSPAHGSGEVEFSLPWVVSLTANPSVAYAFILGLFADGKISLRMNSVSSAIFSGAGLWPNDGVPRGVQMRLAVTGPFEVSYAIDLDNVTVWSGLYDFTVYGTPGATLTDFATVSLGNLQGLTHVTAYDNLEVDNSSVKVAWPVCPAMLPVRHAIPEAVVTGFAAVIGATTFTITGENFRTASIVTVEGPGDISLTATKLVVTETEMTCQISQPFTAGPWCVSVLNQGYCFDGEWE